MEWAAIWFIGTVLVAWWAHAKGRSAAAALAISLLFSPVIGAIVVALWADGAARDYDAAKRGVSRDFKTCPKCAELVRVEASTCKHCGADLHSGPGNSEEEATRRLVEALERRSRT